MIKWFKSLFKVTDDNPGLNYTFYDKYFNHIEEHQKLLNGLKTNPAKVLEKLDLEVSNSGKVQAKKSQTRRIHSATTKTLQKRTQKKRSRNKAAKKRV